jgi:glutaredoxin 3
MANKRAGCATCPDAIEVVKRRACSSCEAIVRDTNDRQIARRAKELRVRSVPAIMFDGKLASRRAGRGVDIGVLKDAGPGKALQ